MQRVRERKLFGEVWQDTGVDMVDTMGPVGEVDMVDTGDLQGCLTLEAGVSMAREGMWRRVGIVRQRVVMQEGR